MTHSEARSVLDSKVSKPEDVLIVLDVLEELCGEAGVELSHAHQSRSAGRPWFRAATVLYRAQRTLTKAWKKMGYL